MMVVVEVQIAIWSRRFEDEDSPTEGLENVVFIYCGATARSQPADVELSLTEADHVCRESRES